MKLTEKQIWKCNNDGEGGFHICLDHQNVVDFARAIEREIGFARAELWLKRINEAVSVAAEQEAIAELADASVNADKYPTLTMLAQAIRMRGDK